MRFLFVSYIRSSGFTDPQHWISRIGAYLGVLQSLAREQEVTSIEQINYTGDLLLNGVQYHFIDSGKPKLYFPWKLHRFIKTKEPDIVLVHGTVFPLQVIQLRLKLGTRVKIILQSHENATPKGYRKLLQKMADRCVDAYFFTARQTGETWLKEGLIRNSKKIHEVMVGSSVFYPVDKQEARKKVKVYGEPIFLWVGKLDENKDPLTVINAFLRFADVCAGARLYMIHQTNELADAIGILLKDHPHTNAIILVGKVEHAGLLYWFNSADFFISGSHKEVFGAVVVEAMSCNCIPLVTDIPSFKKITGGCGSLYEPGNEAELLEVLHQSIQMNREEALKKIQERFNMHLSFDSIARRIQEIAASL